MNKRFWLSQSFGWLVFTALQLAAEPADEPVIGMSPGVLAVALSALAMLGSLGLRMAYRRAQAAQWSEFRMLVLVALCSLFAAIIVDMCFYVGLWVLSLVNPAFQALYENQPLLARAPLLLVAYFLWSLLYVALSRQQSLRQATIAQRELQLALKEAQLQALMGHLGPHFMFNAINNIRALILKDADAARSMLGKFATMLRYQFNQHDSPLVTVAEEMAIVRDYIDLLRLQLGQRLQYSEQVDETAQTMLVPRHALQLLVENGIKHGLGLTPTPGQLRVDVQRSGNGLQLDVRNTGTLRARALSNGTGLNNLEQRLRLGFGSGSRLELLQDGEFVLASLRLGEST